MKNIFIFLLLTVLMSCVHPPKQLTDEVINNLFKEHVEPKGKGLPTIQSNQWKRQPRKFDISQDVLKSIKKNNSDSLKLDLPTGHKLRLKKADIHPNVKVGNSFNGVISERDTVINSILSYSGKVDGEGEATITMDDSEAVCMFSKKEGGNFNLEKSGGEYIFYNDTDLIHPPFTCDLDTVSVNQFKRKQKAFPTIQSSVAPTSNCVQYYYEVDNSLYRGTISSTLLWAQALFNQIQIVYANDDIKINLKTVFIWQTASPFSGNSSCDRMFSFRSYRTQFDGDLAICMGTAAQGGCAILNGLCTMPSLEVAYCGISPSFSNVPNYSWSVVCVAHESAHQMGVGHTHSKAWKPHQFAKAGYWNVTTGVDFSRVDTNAYYLIDSCGNCAGYGEGSAPVIPGYPALPYGHGTIPSYCHLNVGINLADGLGQLPREQIQFNVANGGAMHCLTPCTSGCTPSTTTEKITFYAGNSLCTDSIRTRKDSTCKVTVDTFYNHCQDTCTSWVEYKTINCTAPDTGHTTLRITHSGCAVIKTDTIYKGCARDTSWHICCSTPEIITGKYTITTTGLTASSAGYTNRVYLHSDNGTPKYTATPKKNANGSPMTDACGNILYTYTFVSGWGGQNIAKALLVSGHKYSCKVVSTSPSSTTRCYIPASFSVIYP